MKINKIEIFSYIVLFVVVSASIYIEFFNSAKLGDFTKEDGILEYSTAIFLFLAAIVSFIRFFKNIRNKNILKAITALFFVVALVFVSGEEISWGQRIFGIDSSEFFKDNNTQGEMNLHNLRILGVKLNLLIFGKILSFFLAFYFVVLPFLYNRIAIIKKLTSSFGVPVVKYHHSLVAAIISIAIFIIPSGPKWEVFEFSFSILILIILLFPQNKKIIL